jgi:hypothetical protein
LSLNLPLRNEGGEVIPHDHPGILVTDGVIRRISEQQIVYDDKAAGGRRISSLAFKASAGLNGGMSVDLQMEIEAAGLDARQYVTTPRWMGSIRFEAGSLRAESLQVGFDPLPDNPYHGEIWGDFSRSKVRRLRELCQWFVPIDNVSI